MYIDLLKDIGLILVLHILKARLNKNAHKILVIISYTQKRSF